jgi:hypothetical protein
VISEPFWPKELSRGDLQTVLRNGQGLILLDGLECAAFLTAAIGQPVMLPDRLCDRRLNVISSNIRDVPYEVARGLPQHVCWRRREGGLELVIPE